MGLLAPHSARLVVREYRLGRKSGHDLAALFVTLAALSLTGFIGLGYCASNHDFPQLASLISDITGVMIAVSLCTPLIVLAYFFLRAILGRHKSGSVGEFSFGNW